MESEQDAFFLEEASIDDGDSDFEYKAVEGVVSDDESMVEEDLETAMRVMKTGDAIAPGSPEVSTARPKVTRTPALVDDFIRNFLVKMGMADTLDVFQREFFELTERGKLDPTAVGGVPDVYQRNQKLDEGAATLRDDLERTKEALKKSETVVKKLQKERDFHRMHHKRVLEEKKKLVHDMKRLKTHYEKFEPALEQQKRRYDTAVREKSIVRLEVDKLRMKVESLQSTIAQLEAGGGGGGGGGEGRGGLGYDRNGDREGRGRDGGGTGSSRPGSGTRARGPRTLPPTTALPNTGKRRRVEKTIMPEPSPNPFIGKTFEPARGGQLSLNQTVNAHDMSIGALDVHPKKNIVATVSDDLTWKIWSIPQGLLICSGEGHKDWIGGVAFHPQGSHLATSSGDGTVKLWNFAKNTCTMTLAEHTQAVWGVSFHESGEYLASCSMDHTSRLWDVRSRKCVVTFRGHVNSVNAVCFQPYSNVVCTASGDKTVSMWDPNTSLCTTSLFGHRTAVNDLAFNLQGTYLASSDAEGVVKIWDVRKAAEVGEVNVGGEHPFAANDVAFDRSGKFLAIASDDGTTKVYDVDRAAVVNELKAEDAVQACVFTPDGQFLVTAGSDAKIRVFA